MKDKKMDPKKYLIEIVSSQKIEELKEFILKNSGFNYNFTTEKGENLLHFCVVKLSENTLSIIQILLEKNVDCLAVNENFITPIEVAQQCNNIPALTLMKHYINKKNKEERAYF